MHLGFGLQNYKSVKDVDSDEKPWFNDNVMFFDDHSSTGSFFLF